MLQHKQHRRLALGDHVTLHFEDMLTMQYQVQEMLRIERIFEAEGIQEELDAYNPLIPDGANWKATMLIEYSDAEERQAELVHGGRGDGHASPPSSAPPAFSSCFLPLAARLRRSNTGCR